MNTWELAQLDRHGTVNTTVIGSRVQSLLEVTFFAELFYALIQCNDKGLSWPLVGSVQPRYTGSVTSN